MINYVDSNKTAVHWWSDERKNDCDNTLFDKKNWKKYFLQIHAFR